MKYLLALILCFAFSAINAQSIKMKIAGLTAADGEDIVAFETSDTVPPLNATGGTTGNTIFEYVKVKKLQNTSTVELWKRSVTAGAVTANMTFEFYNAAQAMTFKIVLLNVNVQHFSFLNPECTNCSKLFNQMWLDYQSIETYDMIAGTSFKYNKRTRTQYF